MKTMTELAGNKLKCVIGIAQSKTRKQVAQELGLSLKTVEWHLWTGAPMIGLLPSDYAGMARWAIKTGRITP